MTLQKEALVSAVLRGIAAANAKYAKWSGGSWLTDYGVEGFMAAQIAEAIRNEQQEDESLLLEAPFEQIRHWSGASRPRGRPREVLRGNRRADIAVFDRRGRTVHVIEAKRSWERTGCFRDIERLRALLDACARQRAGSLKCGVLALLIVEWGPTWREARVKIEKKAERIETDVRESFGIGSRQAQFCLGRTRRYPIDYGNSVEWAAAGFCGVFSS